MLVATDSSIKNVWMMGAGLASPVVSMTIRSNLSRRSDCSEGGFDW